MVAELFGAKESAIFRGAKSGTGSLLQRIEVLSGGFEIGFAGANDFAVHGFERLFGGNAVEPALMRKFFVVGKIETNEQAYAAACVVFAWLSGRLLRSFGVLCSSVAGLFRCFRFFAVELEKDFLVEAEPLLPAFELVARLLGCFFIGAEIEDQE
jgi:hypothetical protein